MKIRSGINPKTGGNVEADRKTMLAIKEYLVAVLNQKYGYCGVAEGENMVMLNSGKANLIIKITVTQ